MCFSTTSFAAHVSTAHAIIDCTICVSPFAQAMTDTSAAHATTGHIRLSSYQYSQRLFAMCFSSAYRIASIR